MTKRYAALAGGFLLAIPILLSWATAAQAQEWRRSEPRYPPQRDDAYQAEPDSEPADPPSRYDGPPRNNTYGRPGTYGNAPPSDAYPPRSTGRAPANDAYSPRAAGRTPPAEDAHAPPPRSGSPPSYAQQDQPQDRAYRPPRPGQRNEDYGPPPSSGRPYGEPYGPPPGQASNDPRGYGPSPEEYDRRYGPGPRRDGDSGSYSSREILDTGHGFFGSVSKGLASVVEYVFRKQGRPNGYILGQEAGGALVAGLRYGEGVLYTKDAGEHRVYWQGPSVGWDLGGEGSKVMMLIYNLHDPDQIYQRFGGVDGSAYFVGGVGVTFQANDDVIIAPIRAGVGLRLGANVGYLKYTRRPTWNPF